MREDQKYNVLLGRAYWSMEYTYTMRGDDAEDTQLPDVFMMKSKLGDSRMSAPDVPVLIYTANASKTNNEDRVEVGGAIRQTLPLG